MPMPFVQLTREEFADLLARFPFQRQIDSVHMHHTWQPRQRDFRGVETIIGMWRFHTTPTSRGGRGFSDIAQHISIAPDGTIWTGRDWNRPPASAVGFNGKSSVGPFMFEIIGNFDQGQERLEGAQLETVLDVIALVQQNFGLATETLRFHRQMSTKSCPGSSVDRGLIMRLVEERRATVRDQVAARDAAVRPFGDEALAVRENSDRALDALTGRGSTRDVWDEPNAELEEEEMSPDAARDLAGAADAAGAAVPSARGDDDLPSHVLDELAPYVINLSQGRFSTGGLFETRREDVDAIFARIQDQIQALSNGAPVRVVFYAHGGLVDERGGLAAARKHVDWWVRNGVYPVYFVWETGLCEQIGQLLARSGGRVPRALPGTSTRDIADYTIDPVVEGFARAFGGVGIWGSMKASARFAVDPGEGAARYVATKLKALCDANPGRVELHAVGHSAGSIFHAHFLATAVKLGVPQFRTVQFLAPAVRVDLFRSLLEPLLGAGKGVDRLTIYTMRRRFEKEDDCIGVYQKSLLYLIYNALEPERREVPILGLQICLTADGTLKKLFGLDGQASAVGEVVWSPTGEGSEAEAKASKAISHGDFDDDAPTMNSVACQVLGAAAPANLTQRYEQAARRARGVVNCLKDVGKWRALGAAAPGAWGAGTGGGWAPPPAGGWAWGGGGATSSPAPGAPFGQGQGGPSGAAGAGPGGRRRALCVGINRYPTAPLNGCVADSAMWDDALRELGFETRRLTDEQATRSAILEQLEQLVTTSTAGDVIVFQFSGHGTELRDVNGDETGGNNGRLDEAICPVDFASGAFIIDDDVAGVFARLPASVNLTCFVDCCHSGTISRFAVGEPPDRSEDAERRARYIVADAALLARHQAFRAARRGERGVGVRSRVALTPPRARGPVNMREVVYSACRDDEVAWESGGHGEFTVRAVPLLRASARTMSHRQFRDSVAEAFGPAGAQHPELDCSPAALDGALLEPLGAAAAPARPGAPPGTQPGATSGATPGTDVAMGLGDLSGGNGAGPLRPERVAQLLQAIASLLDRD